MTQSHIEVDTDYLSQLARTVDSAADDARRAADGVRAANSFGFEACGFALGQVFAVPTRAVLARVGDSIGDIAVAIESHAQVLRVAAASCADTENANVDTARRLWENLV